MKMLPVLKRRLMAWMREEKACKAIAKIPGVGLLTATAAVATMGNANAIKSGREFAAWLGLYRAKQAQVEASDCWASAKRGYSYL